MIQRLSHRLSRTLSRLSSSAYRGAIDAYVHGALQGWVFAARHPDERPRIDVYVNGTFIGEVTCDEGRQDLVEHGYGDGRYGFRLPLPWYCLTGTAAVVELYLSDRSSTEPVFAKSVTFPAAGIPACYAEFRGLRLNYLYGWGFAGHADRTPLEVLVRVDGEAAGCATACLYDQNAKRMHPGLCGFLCHIAERWLDGKKHRVDILDAASARILSSAAFSHLPAQDVEPGTYASGNGDAQRMGLDPVFHHLVYGRAPGRAPHRAPYELSNRDQGRRLASSPGSGPEGDPRGPAVEELLSSWASLPKTKLRILATSHDASRTGAPMIILELLRLLKRDYDVELFTLLLREGELLDAFKEVSEVLVAESLPPHGLATDLTPFMRALNGPHTLALCNSAETVPLMKIISAMGIPTYSLVHEFIHSYADDRFDSVFAASDMVIFPSSLVRDTAVERLRLRGTLSEEALVIPQGLFNPALLEDHPDAAQAVRTELGLRDDTFLVLAAGSLDPRKGCDLFVHVAHALKRRGRIEDFAFVWVGQNYNAVPYGDAYMYWIRQDIDAAGLREQVLFVGGRDDVSPFYAAADAFVMLSRLDPFPCVVLEAMAAALPVIAFDGATGSTDILTDGAGICVPLLDLMAVAEQLERLAEAPEEARAVGRRARERIARGYNFEHYLAQVMSAIAEQSEIPLLKEQFLHPETCRTAHTTLGSYPG